MPTAKARILKVESARIVEELDEGNIVIVAGFQGITVNPILPHWAGAVRILQR